MGFVRHAENPQSMIFLFNPPYCWQWP